MAEHPARNVIRARTSAGWMLLLVLTSSILWIALNENVSAVERSGLRFQLSRLREEEGIILRDAWTSLDFVVLQHELTPEQARSHEYERGAYRDRAHRVKEDLPLTVQADLHYDHPTGMPGFDLFFFGWSSAEADKADAGNFPVWVKRLAEVRRKATLLRPTNGLPEGEAFAQGRDEFLQVTDREEKLLAQGPSLLLARSRFLHAFRAYGDRLHALANWYTPSSLPPVAPQSTDRYFNTVLALGATLRETTDGLNAELSRFGPCPYCPRDSLASLRALIESTRELVSRCGDRFSPDNRQTPLPDSVDLTLFQAYDIPARFAAVVGAVCRAGEADEKNDRSRTSPAQTPALHILH